MELSVIIPHIEALIFASDKPITTLEMVDLVNQALAFMEERTSLDQVESGLEAIREKYSGEFYPFEVRESGGGWQFLTKGEFHNTVALLNGDKFLKRLSNAALETLSIIAYKQPITKGEIESIRGVNCDYAVQKLLEKELVVILGRKENAPGQPLIYATSKNFMDYFGINSVDDLPKLAEILPINPVMPTTVGQAQLVDEDMMQVEEASLHIEDATNLLAVNADGEMEEIPATENIQQTQTEDTANENADMNNESAQENDPENADTDTEL